LAKKTLRDLGLGTLERQQTGLNNAQSWIRNSAALTVPQMFNISSMFLTPSQVFEMDFQNQTQQFSRDWMEEQLDWGSDWKTLTGKAISNFDQQLQNPMFSMIGTAGGAVAKGVGGAIGQQLGASLLS